MHKLLILVHCTDRRLRDNKFNGTLNIGTEFSRQLELVDLQNNDIELYTAGGGYQNNLMYKKNRNSFLISICFHCHISALFAD